MRVVLIGFLLLGACGPPSPTTATATPSPVSPDVSAAPSQVQRPSAPIATLTFTLDTAGRWPALLLYEGDGGVVRQRTESDSRELARPCGPVTGLEARPAGLLVRCHEVAQYTDLLRLVSLPDGRVTTLASGVSSGWSADVSPDGNSVAAFRQSDCPSPAPVCQTRAVLVDVAKGTERELLPSGYHLGATLGWTALGLTLFQPECAEAGCTSRDKTGTFVWDGAAFRRWSDLRFVATSGDWTLLERLRSFGEESRAVVVRGPQGESTLSPGRALAITSSGDTLLWRPGDPREQRGVLLRLAPDGRVLWQAEFAGTVLKMIGSDAFLAASPTSKIELYDLKRMLRFTPSLASFVVAGVAR